MKKSVQKLSNLFLRYILILILGLGNLWIFYKIFTPLTIQTTAFFINLFSPTIITENIISFSQTLIKIIPACVAGAAYYLLFILIFSIPNIKIKKRIQVIFFSFITLFVLNITRILILILINKSIYFESLHLVFWYGLSTLFVVGIWILAIRIYKIKAIPVYSDIKFILSLIPKKFKTKSGKPIKKSQRRK